MSPIPDSLSGEDGLHLAQRRQHHRRGVKPQYRSLNRLVRAGAKHLVESGQTDIFPDCHQDHSQLDKASLRSHIQQDIRQYYFNIGKSAYRGDQIPNYNGPTPRKLDGQDDGRDLAYSDIELPSDRSRLVRRPTLEREDAFWYASTSKIHIRRRVETANEDQQVADLYRMGLLYDNDEQDRGGGGDSFNLNSIRHDEPLYPIRPARRTRKHKAAKDGFADQALHLNLSFSDLGDDDVLAQYLMAWTRPHADEAIQHAPRELAESQPPLRVIYELSTSQPSFDIDTSQPPELVLDALSDYDCFSDGELDDTPSQREVQEHADNPPADSWVILGDDS
ncbi:hypothetical protein X797_007135 [Metarhizium robertsii]|uniref:Uncharacterized protein n=2 Tax=Metarhizium robertsii TaxID=568076 RepID=E9F4F4_METRA|nr:uncharacterized protein MAA_07153 [Metarhizium robertsii ARSEF 23]EFY97511.1 hypothetical protein MAA_07153 [Metarhizium robertsii ARSEF 23]EXU99668.1 hypothetical protein X797_007135 [Metarhizium robertsii]